MHNFVYEYRIQGQSKTWLVRTAGSKAELRKAIEAKTGPLDFLMLVRTATGKDSYLPFVGSTAAAPAVTKAVANSWDTVLDKLKAKDRVSGTPANSESVSDSWSRAIDKARLKQREDTASA